MHSTCSRAAVTGIDPIVHVSSFTALFRADLEVLHADLPVIGGSDGAGCGENARHPGPQRCLDCGGRARDLAALHVALVQPAQGPLRCMAGGRRIPVDQLASLIGAAADQALAVYPIPDTVGTECRDPPDRARPDDRVERVVWQPDAVGGPIEVGVVSPAMLASSCA